MVVVAEQVSDGTHNIMVFLTTWTYLVETVFFFIGAVLAVLYAVRPGHFSTRGHSERRPQVELRKKTASDGGNENSGSEGVEKNGISHSNKTQSGEDSRLQGQSSAGTLPTHKFGASLNDRKSSRSDESRNTHSVEARPPPELSNVNESALPWYVQVYWSLCNVIQVFAIVVTGIYFGALYPTFSANNGGIRLHDLNVHGLSSVMVLIDIAVCARPVRLWHGLYPLLYGATYIVFSIIYWSRNPQRNVLYENVLDWNQPGITVGVVLGTAVVGIPLLQLANFGLYRLRLFLYRKIYRDEYL